MIFEELLPQWENLFLQKNADYNDESFHLGSIGQLGEILRKTGKLDRAMIKGIKLSGEQPDEVLLDVIGHCFLTLYLRRKEEEVR